MQSWIHMVPAYRTPLLFKIARQKLLQWGYKTVIHTRISRGTLRNMQHLGMSMKNHRTGTHAMWRLTILDASVHRSRGDRMVRLLPGPEESQHHSHVNRHLPLLRTLEHDRQRAWQTTGLAKMPRPPGARTPCALLDRARALRSRHRTATSVQCAQARQTRRITIVCCRRPVRCRTITRQIKSWKQQYATTAKDQDTMLGTAQRQYRRGDHRLTHSLHIERTSLRKTVRRKTHHPLCKMPSMQDPSSP
jgi:hypothetical protein